MVIVVLVLLIAGANVGNLLLSRQLRAKLKSLCDLHWARAGIASCASYSVETSRSLPLADCAAYFWPSGVSAFLLPWWPKRRPWMSTRHPGAGVHCRCFSFSWCAIWVGTRASRQQNGSHDCSKRKVSTHWPTPAAVWFGFGVGCLTGGTFDGVVDWGRTLCSKFNKTSRRRSWIQSRQCLAGWNRSSSRPLQTN